MENDRHSSNWGGVNRFEADLNCANLNDCPAALPFFPPSLWALAD